MSQGIRIASVKDIPAGEGRLFNVKGTKLAVFHTHDGEVFATQPDCPHLGGPLADGLIGGATLACPLHDRIFDLRTGCGLSHEKPTLTVYPVALSAAGDISVSLQPMSVVRTEAAAS